MLPVDAFQLRGTLSDAAVDGLIDAASSKTDWPTYFDTCAATTCTYSVSPSNLQLATVVMGIIGGLTGISKTIISFFVDELYDRLFAAKEEDDAKKAPSAQAAAGGDESGIVFQENPIRKSGV